MAKLRELLWPVVREYTRKISDLFGGMDWHWIGTDDDGIRPIDVCELGGTMYLTLEDMQIIIDRMDDWVRRYGSKEAVAQEVRDWFDFWLDDKSIDGHPLVELMDTRLGRYQRTRPSINLESWLMGCPREQKKATAEDELRLLLCQRDLLVEVFQEYRNSPSLEKILLSMTYKIKKLQKEVNLKQNEGRKV